MAPPPDLIDDATAEILLRLPPDDPACLVRASVVCKAWRELLSSRAFLRRYRAFHGAPPLLGFLHNTYDVGPCARFVAVAADTTTTSPFSAPAFDRFGCWIVECRHGRALLYTFEPHVSERLVVWDPITGDQQYLPVSGYPYFCRTAAVLCAADGCDHLDCHGGPFLVVAIGAYEEDALYFSAQQGKRILKYDFNGQDLHAINAPDMFELTEGIVVTAEDGGLGLAGVKDGNLHLWSWQADPRGIAEWVQFRVVKLRTLFPVLHPLASLDVIGFQEGTDTIFISLYMDVFAIMLRSEQVKKVGKTGSKYAMAPYVSFYTPDLAKGRLLDAVIHPIT